MEVNNEFIMATIGEQTLQIKALNMALAKVQAELDELKKEGKDSNPEE